jgi:tripeptidyl-peptidase I
MKALDRSTTGKSNGPAIDVPSASGGQVDASCNDTITITCLKELYNAVGYVPLANTGNQIAATGYLDQFANLEDLQLFYENQVPEAVNSSFTLVSVNGECAAVLYANSTELIH